MDNETENFFASLSGLSHDAAFAECKSYGEQLKNEIADLHRHLAGTPRGDKSLAHDIKQELLSAQAKLRKLKPVMAHYRAETEKRDSQYLWASAVRQVCGQDKLHEVYKWMAAEKKRRSARGVA